MFVVLSPEHEQLPGRLHVVQVGVQIGEEDGDLAAGVEEVGDLGHGHEVGDMGLASGSSSPVDLEVAGLEHLVDAVVAQHLLQVPGYEGLLLGGREVAADGGGRPVGRGGRPQGHGGGEESLEVGFGEGLEMPQPATQVGVLLLGDRAGLDGPVDLDVPLPRLLETGEEGLVQELLVEVGEVEVVAGHAGRGRGSPWPGPTERDRTDTGKSATGTQSQHEEMWRSQGGQIKLIHTA